MSRWQEVEVELTGGDRRLLEAADDLLRHYDGLRPAGRAAKLARALGDRLPEPEDRPQLTASSPAGQVVLAYLRAHACTLMSLDPLARLDEPDSVHQMRVASRRLRSTLRSFGYILPVTTPQGWPPTSSGSAACSAMPATARCWPSTCGPGCARFPRNCASDRWKRGSRATSRR